ncbi:MAG: DUF2207 domain-containing protein [Clostridia bacterium]|nr:DUF2207 domain-containing protein [Clostridia bacterium]
MKQKIKSKLTLYFVFAIISAIIIIAIGSNKQAPLYMEQLDYNVNLNDDGSMEITEIWDINIDHINTLFKNFKLSSKFGKIQDVTVKDLTTGKNLKQINEEMYHVTTDCYYALNLSKYKFEIAWGTGMENTRGRRIYEIKYKVTDVITQYKDCQELYWMFLDTVNEIPVKNVNMKITLPNEVEDIENLKVWGHGPLNGKIEKISKNTVAVSLKNLEKGKMLEVRIATKDKIFNNINSNKIKNYSYLDRMIEEETYWAEEANDSSNGYKVFIGVVAIIYFIILCNQIRNIIKYTKIQKQQGDGLDKKELQYYRDIPRENDSTPAEANYLYKFQKNLYKDKKSQSNIIAATILDLCLKKYITLRTTENKVYVKIEKDSSGLKRDEKEVYSLLKNAGNGKEEFEITQLNEYAKKHYTQYSRYINQVYDDARNELYQLKLVDKAQYKQYNKIQNAGSKYTCIRGSIEFVIIAFLIGTFIFPSIMIGAFGIGYAESFIKILLSLSPYFILKLIALHKLSKLENKIAVLTQKGYEEQIQWEALARYMKEFSLLNEKEIPSLAVWEKYLVYATAFDIAEVVIEQMKAKYPEVFVKEYWEDSKNTTQAYQIVRFATMNYDNEKYYNNPIHILESNVERAYKTSLSEISAHASSSGSGGGGGFSGGGGGRWWRWPEWAEDKTSPKIRLERDF